MINRFSSLLARKGLICKTVTRSVGGDWNRDRERAAEKEYMIREERKRMGNMRNRSLAEVNRSVVEGLSDDDEDIMHVLRDRDNLGVSL